MYNVCQTTEFMTKFRERTMPSKCSSCDNALPSRSTSTSLVLKRAKFRNHQLHFLTLITTKIKTQEEAKMPLCKLKKTTQTKKQQQKQRSYHLQRCWRRSFFWKLKSQTFRFSDEDDYENEIFSILCKIRVVSLHWLTV